MSELAKIEVIHTTNNVPTIKIRHEPVLVFSIGKMFEEDKNNFKENVVDIDAISQRIDDLYDKATALLAQYVNHFYWIELFH